MTDEAPRGLLRRYALLSYLALLLNHALYLGEVAPVDAVTVLFAGAVALSGPMILLLPALAPALLLRWGLRRRGRGEGAVAVVAVIGVTAMHLLLHADRRVFSLFGFHLNGFVWNILSTSGGIESLGAGGSTTASAAGVALGFLALQAGLLVLLRVSPRLRSWGGELPPKRLLLAVALPAFLLLVTEKVIHGVGRAVRHGPVLAAGAAFPFHLSIQIPGFPRARAPSTPRINDRGTEPRYPLAEIRRDPARPKLNIVWLVVESWRADVLDPEITPAVSGFASKSVHFRNHVSGGNGTRMGFFSMFYGLPGTYWFPFLDQRRGPVLMRLLRDEGYRFGCYTSSGFRYPELERTAFVDLPSSGLKQTRPPQHWTSDRENTGLLLDFLDQQDPAQPFMAFQFLEATHQGYDFPPEAVIREPYAPRPNYMAFDPGGDIAPIRNRYLNACRHVDTEIGRILDRLRERGLMSSTLVIIAGDHGEEFMERGRWGHCSDFSEPQIRTPLVLWVPGRAPAVVDRLTSHLDIPATVMTALGVTTPPSDYSLGEDLFGPSRRESVVVTHWNRFAYVDGDCKIEMSIVPGEFIRRAVTTRDDRDVADEDAVIRAKAGKLAEMIGELKRFRK